MNDIDGEEEVVGSFGFEEGEGGFGLRRERV